jgi:hypothetical protein
MKRKKCILSSTIALSCIFMTGCPPIWQSTPETQVIQTDYGHVEISPALVDRKDPRSGYEGFWLHVTNDTDKDISIIWQKTFYAMSGSTNGWFFFLHDRFAEASNPKPPDIVFKKSEFVKWIYPVKLVHYDCKDGWWEEIMPEGENGIYLTVQSYGQEINTKITVDLEKVDK